MFAGFSDSETFTRVPDSLFRLLNVIEDVDELKVTLYALWRIEHIEGPFRHICRSEILEDEDFMRGMPAQALDNGLEKAVARGTLLRVENEMDAESGQSGFYFLNSPRGRASAEALKKGQWRKSALPASAIPRERPNVFKLYEENIGPLTPGIADFLGEAEKEYSAEWISDALEEALKRNKRNWKYIEAILKRWKEEGRAEKQDRPDDQETRRRDDRRKFEDFLNRRK